MTDNKQQAEDISSIQKQVKELGERIKKLENSEMHHDNKGMNEKLSNYAHKVVQGSRGPLKPDELIKHFTGDVSKKDALVVIRKFSNDTDEIKNQLSHIYENIENQMTFRKKENELDDKFIKRIRKFNKIVEEKQEKEAKSNVKPKIQSTMDQFFGMKPGNLSTRNKKALSKAEVVGKPKVGKRRMHVKEADKENRKRKTRNDDEDDESCSSQEVEVEQITVKFNKRLKLNPSQESIESNAEKESVLFNQRREPRPMISIQSSSEGSSQSDVLSEDDSTEIIKKNKSDVKKATKRSKQLKPRSNENAPEYNGNEKTFIEKNLPLRRKQIR